MNGTAGSSGAHVKQACEEKAANQGMCAGNTWLATWHLLFNRFRLMALRRLCHHRLLCLPAFRRRA